MLNPDILWAKLIQCNEPFVAKIKIYMYNAQALNVCELSHDNARNSVCSHQLLKDCLEHNDQGVGWGGNSSR